MWSWAWGKKWWHFALGEWCPCFSWLGLEAPKCSYFSLCLYLSSQNNKQELTMWKKKKQKMKLQKWTARCLRMYLSQQALHKHFCHDCAVIHCLSFFFFSLFHRWKRQSAEEDIYQMDKSASDESKSRCPYLLIMSNLEFLPIWPQISYHVTIVIILTFVPLRQSADSFSSKINNEPEKNCLK